MPSSVPSGWNFIRLVLRSVWAKIAALLAVWPLIKLLWKSVDAYGNVRMIIDNATTILSFLGSWPGAITLMIVGFVLLAARISQVRKQLDPFQNTAVANIRPLDDGATPREQTITDVSAEDLVRLFDTNAKLLTPYFNQWLVADGFVQDSYFETLKANTTSAVLNRASGVNVIMHFSLDYRGQGGNLREGCEVRARGQLIAVDNTSVTLDDCEILEVKPPRSALASAETSVAESSERTVVEITPEELARMYENLSEEQRERLLGAYLGEWIFASGTIVRSHMYGPKANETTVLLKTGEVHVYARFPDWHQAQPAHLAGSGKHIKVLGRIDEIQARVVNLADCELVEIKLPPLA